jgi:hypothetical protein
MHRHDNTGLVEMLGFYDIAALYLRVRKKQALLIKKPSRSHVLAHLFLRCSRPADHLNEMIGREYWWHGLVELACAVDHCS